MQSTKNRHLRSLDKNVEVKEHTHWSKFSFNWIKEKVGLIPVDEAERLHTQQMNLAQYNRDQTLRRANVEARYFRKY